MWEMGGSNELEGARMAGMMAIQAKWYTNRHPQKRDSKAGFLTAEVPLDILRFFGLTGQKSASVRIRIGFSFFRKKNEVGKRLQSIYDTKEVSTNN